ncbi:hypothetical protein [Neisseria polysaccharea]|uniref:hypothetical protein n=1 Tax=Neisseria polysaccharea TaxID=489 RepID=UPI00272964EB|nr:hypothetical protein [Neisseria polysaccharea]
MQFGLRQSFGCLIPFVTSGIAEFVGNGRRGLGSVFTKLLCYFPSKDYYHIKSIFLSDRDCARTIFRHRPDVAPSDRMLQTASEGFAVSEYEDDNVCEINGI